MYLPAEQKDLWNIVNSWKHVLDEDSTAEEENPKILKQIKEPA